MKKTFLLLAALLTATVMNVQAGVLLDESFNRNAGTLNAGDYNNMGTNTSDWWYTSSTTAKIQVIDTTLTKAGYQTKPAGKAIQFKGNANKDVRAFERFASAGGNSIYYSVLLNVKALKKSTSKDNLITLTDGSTTGGYCYAELRFLNNYDDNTYQLGVTKANENGVRWSKPLPLDSTILAVVRYDFIKGDTNDVVSLWINPTKLDENVPTSLHSVQDTASSQGAKWGANQKVDPEGLKWVFLRPTANTANIILDEIRVASKWADLFEGAPTEPTLKVNPSSTSESYIFQGDSKEYTFTVSGKLLTSDVTISHTNAEVELSTTSLTKEDVMDTTSFKATLTANVAGAQVDTIVLTSGTLVKKIPMYWNTIGITACADVAALKAAVEYEEAYNKYVRLTGEAIVTRDVINGEDVRELFIEDASGAAKLTDDYGLLDAGSLVGAKIKNLLLVNGPAAWGVQPFMVQGKPTVVSTGNEVEPQVVTLAELQENAADYLYEVVEIQGVTFTNPGGTFAVGQSAFTQDTKNANVKVENNSLVGVTVPVKANVIGFSFNTSGSVILPRGAADVVNTLYTRTVTSGNFGTICLDRKFTAMEGVEGLFVPYEKTDDMLYCEEVALSDVVAGGAYIFKANAAEIKFTLDGEAVTASINNDNMIGWLAADSILAAKPAYYLLANNQIMEPEVGSTIKQNRAFIDLANVPAQAAAPARGRLISFGVNAANTPTGLMLNAECTMQSGKVLRNGQLIIIREGHKFNAQGQEL